MKAKENPRRETEVLVTGRERDKKREREEKHMYINQLVKNLLLSLVSMRVILVPRRLIQMFPKLGPQSKFKVILGNLIRYYLKRKCERTRMYLSGRAHA